MYEARQNKEKVSRRIDEGKTKNNTRIINNRKNTVLQKLTEVSYETQNLFYRTKEETRSKYPQIPREYTTLVGHRMKAKLDPSDAISGTGTTNYVQSILFDQLAGDLNIKKNRTNFLAGHLLNSNIGGMGLAYNLFPITNSENQIHERKAESMVKQSLLKGHRVYYKVEAPDASSYSKIEDFISNPPKFKWAASNTSMPTKTGRGDLSLNTHPTNTQIGDWNQNGDGTGTYTDITKTNLSKSNIDGYNFSNENFDDPTDKFYVTAIGQLDS